MMNSEAMNNLNLAVYIKGHHKKRSSNNLIRNDGHIVIKGQELEFEAVLFSYAPHLDKNVSVVFKNSAIPKLKTLGIDRETRENLLRTIQFKLLKDNGVVYEPE